MIIIGITSIVIMNVSAIVFIMNTIVAAMRFVPIPKGPNGHQLPFNTDGVMSRQAGQFILPNWRLVPIPTDGTSDPHVIPIPAGPGRKCSFECRWEVDWHICLSKRKTCADSERSKWATTSVDAVSVMFHQDGQFITPNWVYSLIGDLSRFRPMTLATQI